MKFLISLILIIGSLVGIAMCFLSDIVSDSSYSIFNGLDLSFKLGLFFFVAFLGGLSLMFSRDSL